jgi:uncharacterized membrane protein YccC
MSQVEKLEHAHGASPLRAVRRLRAKDPQFLIVKRSVRAAIVMPTMFAVTHALFSNAQVSLFAAFGSFSFLLLVEFTGPVRTRVLSYLVLFAVGCAFIAIGTAASTNKVAAVIAMGLVAFAVLFAGIVTPLAATASTAALLLFVLPVAVAAPASDIGDRLLGWVLAAIACTAACVVLWPPPWQDNLRRRLSEAARALARLIGARARSEDASSAQREADDALDRLRTQFSATPYPPTGAAAGAVALSKLVGRIEWVAGNSALEGGDHLQVDPQLERQRQQAAEVFEAAGETLGKSAELICDGDAHPVTGRADVAAVRDATSHLDGLIAAELAADVATGAGEGAPAPSVTPEWSEDGSIAGRSLDPGFYARGLGRAVGMVADAALEAAGAEPAPDRSANSPGETSAQAIGHRLLSHLSFRSVWFRNAIRGAAGLALAVTVAEVSDVQHGFWVVLGTLSVLRSNALGTGATALRAIGGTAVGFLVGAAIMVGIADHTVLLWVLLPLAVLVAGIAPSMISFAAGQAGFTLVVIILFNIIEPAGWRVGLTRIEDVALGAAVSVVVGFLFWPRGATAALGRALSDAFVANSAFLADAVQRLTMTSRFVDMGPSERESHRTYLLLDDAFRQFFAERGAKVVPMDTIARIFTGANRLRLAAFTIGTLPISPPAHGQKEVETIEVAEAVLRDTYAATHRWYVEFADFLSDRRGALALPPPHGEMLHHVLRSAFEDIRAQRRPDRVHTALQMLWADQLLESQRSLQADLLASADLFVRRRRVGLV